jgi:hypothetical protein
VSKLEELGIVISIFVGVYTLYNSVTSETSGNANAVPASAPSGTVQTTPFAGIAPTIPIPQLTNPFTSAPVKAIACMPLVHT